MVDLAYADRGRRERVEILLLESLRAHEGFPPSPAFVHGRETTRACLGSQRNQRNKKAPKLSPGRLLLEVSGRAQPCMNEGR